MALSNDLLEILACPKCKGPVTVNQEQDGVVCTACALVYPIVEEIPVMLVEEARPL